MRDSVSLKMIPYLCKKGSKINYYDPTGPKEAFNNIKNCNYSNNIKDACKKVDLVVLHTEWDEFKSLEFNEIIKNKNFKIFDLRNLYNFNDMVKKKRLNIFLLVGLILINFKKLILFLQPHLEVMNLNLLLI